jgi:hypothetical protein
MEQNAILLMETEEMWAKMLMEVLEDNEIPHAAKPVYGAGLVIRAGMQERLEIYVPEEYFGQAKALADALFSEADTIDETDEN